MIYFMIRHKTTGEFMPELVKGRGYSFWNPTREDTLNIFTKKKLTGCPRIFASRRKAHRSIVQWNAMPNSRWHTTVSFEGHEDEAVDIKPDGRSKDDLEVVEVNIEVKSESDN